MKRRSRILLRLGVAFLCAIAIMAGFRRFEHRQVYYPSRILESSPAALGMRSEDVFIPVENGQSINAWYFPATTRSTATDGCVFLYCHGNAGNIGDRLGMTQSLLQAGASVLQYDYRGYGRSAGEPGEENTQRDAQAAFRWLVDRGFPARRIIAYGESLGGGVASELAIREQIGGLVLHSTFTSIPDLGSELFPWLPVRLAGSIRYDTLSKLPRIRVPVLVLHSRSDDLIRYRHAERNFAAANDPKFFCELAGSHGESIGELPSAAQEAVRKFLALVSTNASVPAKIQK